MCFSETASIKFIENFSNGVDNNPFAPIFDHPLNKLISICNLKLIDKNNLVSIAS